MTAPAHPQDTGRHLRGRWVLTAFLVAVLTAPRVASACCLLDTPTLGEEVRQADWVVLAKLTNAQLAPTTKDESAGTTDLVILKVIKPHAILKDRERVTISRYVPVDKDPTFVVFGDASKGRIDAYRGYSCDGKPERMAEYVQAAAKLRDARPAAKLGFHFRHLDDELETVRNDARKVFRKAPFKDIKAAAAAYDRAKLIRWLSDEKTGISLSDHAGVMLGVCGKPEDATFLRRLLDDWPDSKPGSQGPMIGYCLLDPKAGQDFVFATLADGNKLFTARFAALRAVRFLCTETAETDREVLLKRTLPALTQTEIADLIVEEYRMRRAWSFAPQVLAIYGKGELDNPITRRAILRFAVVCPEPAAKAFVEERRKVDPNGVKEMEEIMELEQRSPKP